MSEISGLHAVVLSSQQVTRVRSILHLPENLPEILPCMTCATLTDLISIILCVRFKLELAMCSQWSILSNRWIFIVCQCSPAAQPLANWMHPWLTDIKDVKRGAIHSFISVLMGVKKRSMMQTLGVRTIVLVCCCHVHGWNIVTALKRSMPKCHLPTIKGQDCC